MKWLEEGIIEILDEFSYPFFVVQQDFSVKCSCVNTASNSPRLDCKKCLGTGHKIVVRKIEGYREDNKGTFQNFSAREASASTVYFIKGKYPVYNSNWIVDENDIFMVHRFERKRGKDKKVIFQKCFCVPKKSGRQVFLDNFRKIVSG